MGAFSPIVVINLLNSSKMFLQLPSRKTINIDPNELADVLMETAGCDLTYFTNEGRIVTHISEIASDFVVMNVKLCGGKGAFGSLLRFIGSQIEKTTNREAMRDLSGRRLHDVNNEQRLQEWNERQQERERQKEAEKEEKLQKIRDGPKHNFTDQKYFDQSSSIRNNLEDALNAAFNEQEAVSPQERSIAVRHAKRKAATGSAAPKGKKSRGGMLLDMGMPDSSSDSDSSDSCDGEGDTYAALGDQTYTEENLKAGSLVKGAKNPCDSSEERNDKNFDGCNSQTSTCNLLPESSDIESSESDASKEKLEAANLIPDKDLQNCPTNKRKSENRSSELHDDQSVKRSRTDIVM